MAEAILTLSQAVDRATSGQPIAPDSKRQAQVRASMGAAVMVLARQRALKAAKAKLQAQGLRPSHFSHRDLVIRADQYLAEHRAELVAEAKAIVDHWQAAGVFGKREAFTSLAVQDLTLTHKEGRPETPKLFACRIPVQNEERKMIIGYARVSTDGQTLDAQQAALAAAGAEKVFAEKVSGAVTDRKALGRAIAALGAGDVLLVTRLDRLARSTRDLLNVLDAVGKAGAGFRSLADPQTRRPIP